MEIAFTSKLTITLSKIPHQNDMGRRGAALKKVPLVLADRKSGIGSKQRHPVNLKQYRKLCGKWQFVPVARDAKGNPDSHLVLLNGEQASSQGGTFYLDFSEKGKRKQQAVGTVPREALEAWRRSSPSSPG